MTPVEAKAMLEGLPEGADSEGAHSEADDILCKLLETLGYKEVSDAFKQAKERVVFWYA